MVYTPWKCLRAPFFNMRYWTNMSSNSPIPVILFGMVIEGIWMMKYVSNPTESMKNQFPNGYPTNWDPLREKDQKYWAMYIRQQGIDITDPTFTGMDKQALASLA